MYYIYKSESTTLHTIQDSEIDWNYLDKYSITMGSTVRGFTFTFPNLKKKIAKGFNRAVTRFSKYRNRK